MFRLESANVCECHEKLISYDKFQMCSVCQNGYRIRVRRDVHNRDVHDSNRNLFFDSLPFFFGEKW